MTELLRRTTRALISVSDKTGLIEFARVVRRRSSVMDRSVMGCFYTPFFIPSLRLSERANGQ